MKTKLLLILFLIFPLITKGQEIKKEKEDLMYHINAKGKPLYKERYNEVGKFVDGVAPVKKDFVWYYIDLKGKKVSPENYDWATEFSEGLAVITKLDSANNECCFFIDRNFQLYFKTCYEEASKFKNGKAFVRKEGKKFFINKKEEKL